jgi:hypothetical protein
MIAEDVENTKSQAQRAWGDEKTIQSWTHPKWSGRTGQTSRVIGGEPISDDRDDWARRNITDQRRQGTVGGIVDRLISKTVDLINESEKRTVDLKQHLAELRELSTRLQQKEDQEE